MRPIVRHLLAAAVAVLGCMTAGRADAVLVLGTYEGVITSGIDGTDEFGFGPFASLAGIPINGTFAYDTAQVPPSSCPLALGAGCYESEGLLSWLTMSLTVNDATFTIGENDTADHFQQILVSDENVVGIESLQIFTIENRGSFDGPTFRDETAFLRISFGSDVQDVLDGATVPQNFTFTPGTSDPTFGNFLISDNITDLVTGSVTVLHSALGEFSLSQVTASTVAVPEPGTLPLLALGLIAIATMGRRGLIGLFVVHRRRPRSPRHRLLQRHQPV